MSNKRNLIFAAIALVGVAAYMASGELIIGGTGDHSAEKGQAPNTAEATAPEKLFSVRVEKRQASLRAAELVVRGRSEADNIVSLSAETSGLIESVQVERGQRVKEGDIVCKLETGSRRSRIAQSEAQLVQAEADLKASETLNKSGYVADSRVRLLQAQKDAAEASLKEAKLDLQRTTILAPFSGTIEKLPAKQGQLLRVGDECATLVAIDPLLFVGQVSERSIANVTLGALGTVRFVTGENQAAQISFVSESAEDATRTFRIEATVPNPDGTLRAGVTAVLNLPLQETQAHFVSGSVLTLNDDGQIGVRVVDDTSTVRFMPVTIIGEEPNGLWLAGLPETITLITVGQDFVLDGQKVNAQLITAESAK